MDEFNSKKRGRDDSNESDMDSTEVKRLRDDLLDLLDESDSLPVNQDLASVMKSFEEEISAAASTSTESMPVFDLTSDSGESKSDLGYLLEASDDELGLPPPTSSTTGDEGTSEASDLDRVDSHSSGFGALWGFEDQNPNYDSFEFGFVDNYNVDHVAYDGLFEYSDVYYDSDMTGQLWRLETLSAE
ncbi:putative DNA repair protein RAD23-3 [Hibiscus syriacus]|uniref:DNA repair protein RAD23-3 n=1 Tax=Hibiscus syriacus TaxID=106335 RepID=A0A6A2XLV4_HIBSY|nr:uncharacterized protein LOC120193324 [Hibiscus syriacus]KAE8657447.1 putative DNA repair protein RAD23-3 [Hibiscus syriacus]